MPQRACQLWSYDEALPRARAPAPKPDAALGTVEQQEAAAAAAWVAALRHAERLHAAVAEASGALAALLGELVAHHLTI